MLALSLPPGRLRLLCLGAHSDDIEIGGGGTILRLLEERSVSVDWVVLSGTPQRAREARTGARLFLKGATRSRVRLARFRDGYFPGQFARIKDYFEALKAEVAPDLILCPWREDAHQDHRLVAQLVGNTFRDHLVLEYEIPKYDGDLGVPSVFVPLSEATCRRKIELLHTAFPSQAERRWFADETFRALLRLRGLESNAASSYAEAFHCRKAEVSFNPKGR